VADGGSLRTHLLEHRIAGDVATPRQENLRNFGRMAEGRPNYDFGLVPLRPWSTDEVLAVMAELCGVSADPAYVSGPDTIDVDLTLGALTRWRERLALAAERCERVVLATGHPTGILVVHLELARALRGAGCDVLVPDVSGWRWPWPEDWGRGRDRHVRSVNGVAVLASGGELLHTHAPEPMRALLATLDAPPDLVVADHGWAGTAAEAGIDTLGMADCNDPALFVAEAEGKPIVTVPLDDNVLPPLYDPLTAFLLEGWA
jgi:Phosphatase